MRLDRAVPILHVAVVPAAVRGYRESLGLEVLMDHGWIATLGSAGGAQFSLLARDATADVDPELSLQVEDVDAALQQVRAAGLEIVHGPADEARGVRRFFFRDRDGHVIDVLAHR